MKRRTLSPRRTLDGAAVPRAPLRVTPAKLGSGKRDVSLNHDRYFARDAVAHPSGCCGEVHLAVTAG